MRYLGVIIFLLLTTSVFKQTGFSIRAGLNLSTQFVSGNIPYGIIEKFKPGFQIGVVYGRAISDNLINRTGLTYTNIIRVQNGMLIKVIWLFRS